MGMWAEGKRALATQKHLVSAERGVSPGRCPCVEMLPFRLRLCCERLPLIDKPALMPHKGKPQLQLMFVSFADLAVCMKDTAAR